MNFLLTLLIGIVAGIIDVLPMIKMKVDKFSCASAFVYYLILPFIIFSINWFGDLWWLRGGSCRSPNRSTSHYFGSKRR